jgi:hypothetical protein
MPHGCPHFLAAGESGWGKQGIDWLAFFHARARARGIDQEAARQLLVYSFGAEVTQHLRYKDVQERLQSAVNSTLSKAA